MDSTRSPAGETLLTGARATCPPWCATGHGVHLGEEDWVHLSEPLPLTDGVSAQLCMSIDPLTSAEDGPYVVVGGTEYTLPEAHALAASLMTLATTGGHTMDASVV
jgi:hypothetical protein